MPTRYKLIAAAAAAALALGLAACGTTTVAPAANSEECITSFDASKDYFPAKASFEHALGVKVEYKNSYKVVTVAEPLKGAAPETYVLLQCGAPKPELTGALAGAQVVQIPVKKVATSSTTQLPAFELLKHIDAIAGVESANLVYGENLRKAIDAGKIASYGSESGSINVEKVAALSPDLFVTSGIADPSYDKIKSLGIPTVGNAEWMETSPLGRAEWLKFTALFLNAEQLATTEFETISKHYEEVRVAAAKHSSHPVVVAGAPFKGSWYRQGKDGYFPKFITDAGGRYVFDDVEGSASTPVDIEVVLAKATDADIWLNATTTTKWKTVGDLIKDDPRLGTLNPAKTGQIWNPTVRAKPGGGNDYWQLGVIRPDLVLADLVEIMHPGTLADHTFTFYAKLPK